MDTEQWSLDTSPPLPAYTQPAHPIPQDPVQRFACAFPGCKKQFSRREHLTRHAKTHDPQPQYRCHICGRRYARSDVLKRHVKFHPAFENKTAPEATLPSPDEDMSDPATTTTIVQDGGEPGNIETTCTNPQQTWDQLAQDLWFTPPSSVPYKQGEAAIPSQNNQFPLDQDAGFMYEQAHHEPAFTIPHLDTTDIDTSTSASSAPLQGWDFMESAPTSLASSVLQDQDHPPNVLDGLNKASSSRKEAIEAYLSKIHPFWPILHAPTFNIDDTSDILLASMTMLANWFEGGSDHYQSCTTVFEAVATSQLLANPSLHALQALFLCVVYATYRLSEQGMMTWAVRLNSILISTCRSFGVFSDDRTLPHQPEDSPLAAWLAREHLNRLAFSVLRIDTYLSLILDHPPSLRYEELYIPLPKSARLWEATSDAERRRLQWDEPAGRDKALFSYLMRDAVCGETLPYRLTKDDCHMMLLGLQSGVWEAAREAHSFASDVLDVKLTPGTPIKLWRSRLEQWQGYMEEHCSMQKDYFSDGPHHSNDTANTDLLSPVTLLIQHIASIKMHAPLSILQLSRNSHLKRVGQVAAPAANHQSRLRVWHKSSCPRIAVWNATQIARIASRELHNVSLGAGPARLLNPLIVPGLLMSAVVVYSYVQYTVACGSCLNSSSGEGQASPRPYLDLDMAHDTTNDSSFKAWRDFGNGLATFGAERIPLCRCKTAEITAYFELLLAVDSIAKDEFLAFTREVWTPNT